MQASEEKFTKFISGEVTFVIPVYQRNYDWLKTNCERLFNDITNIIINKKPHFIGTFVYTYDPAVGALQEYVIIDGQQRITSIILFAKALYDSTADEDLKADIRSKFIKHTTGRGLKNKCRLCPTEYDRDTFEKLMSDDAFDENNFTTDEKNSAMYKNYCFFKDKIAGSNFSGEELCDAISQLNIVAILLKEENPQEIFESLNSTGLDLTQADLIRNFLLMSLHDYNTQEELYKKYWLQIEKFLGIYGKVEDFLVQYLITKRMSDSVQEPNKQRLTKRNLYDTFKKFFAKNFPDVETSLKDMLRYAKFFHRVIFNADTKFENLSKLDKKFYELVYLLEANNSPIVLMYLLDRYEKNHFSEETFINFVNALISLSFRAKICGNVGITSQFAGNVLARLDKEPSLDEKSFWRVITFGKGSYSFPSDKNFQESLAKNNLYETIKPNLCKYLLYSLERAAHKELPAYNAATVEHIMPQKLNDVWKKYLDSRKELTTHEIFLHTLGNLTLTNYNSELGNSDFDSKKKTYEQSSYFYTRSLKDYSEWTSKQIQLRAQKLSSEAVKIWTLPEEFNFVLPSMQEVFNFDSDFSDFTGRKPATLIIFDKEIKMPYWNHMLREIVRQLYAIDKDIFRRATQMPNIRQSLFSTEPTDFKIDENFYMQTGFDTESCLRIAKLLIENFDQLGDRNLKENISFTLRK